MLQISQAAAAVGPPSDGTQLRLLTTTPSKPRRRKGWQKGWRWARGLIKSPGDGILGCRRGVG